MDVDRGTTGKRMNMGMFTGMFPKTFAVHMGWDQATAKTMWNKWHALFPGVGAFQRKAKAVMLSRGYVKTALGRRCRMDNAKFAYKAVSRIIQGSGADIMKYKLLEVDKLLEEGGDKVHILMTVHDSIVFQFHEEDVETLNKAITMMGDLQTEPFNFKVPFAVDNDRGLDWAEASFGGK